MANTTVILDLFKRLGISINLKKSSLTPSRKVVFLGVLLHLDRMSLEIPPKTVQKIIALCGKAQDSTHLSRRQLESIMGLLNFAAPLVPLGRLRLRPILI